jgi:hypothetical protein
MVRAGENDCGDGTGKVFVMITTTRPSTRIQYASVRVFGFCEETISDMNLRERCIMWREVGKVAHRLIGNYKVRVVWQDGRAELFNMPVDEIEPDNKGVRRFVLGGSL